MVTIGTPPCLIFAYIPWLKTSIPKARWSFAMRAMFVACCLGLLVGVVASPVHARAFCKSKDCQQTSVRKVAPKHTATSVQKAAPKHTATSVQKAAPKHTATSVRRPLVNTLLRLFISSLLNTPRLPMLRSTQQRRPLRSTPLCTAPRSPFTLPRPSLSRLRSSPRAGGALRGKRAIALSAEARN